MSVLTVDQPRQWPPDPNSPEEQRKRARAKAIIEELFGPSDDPAAGFVCSVMDAQVNAMAWARGELGGVYPTPRPIADRLDEVAGQLRSIVDNGYTAAAEEVNPTEILDQVAREALAEYRASLPR